MALLALEVVAHFQMFSLSHSQPNTADTVNHTIWMDGDWMLSFYHRFLVVLTTLMLTTLVTMIKFIFCKFDLGFPSLLTSNSNHPEVHVYFHLPT
jgi:hypothetical protein